ncbi:nitrate reductase cytochrome c-type subunit [Stieleria sp. TO1_6]|uniref:nitrate reductase cytochrome c-type subunit n=1 Tax=Stieleria tagensis TaxID=2956795 RepID=UPI00209B276B|nr:nitrate reductase cytochrome c-type subunit [Stieleria tagensis]MCO8121909.1 nitrate reductase cytochrome c-type subunit [Stieleria tagensis]
MNGDLPVPTDSPDSPNRFTRLVTVVSAIVMAIAVIGLVVGISDGVPQPELESESQPPGDMSVEISGHESGKPQQSDPANPKLIDAVSYAEIPDTVMGPTPAFQAALVSLPPQPEYDLFSEVKLDPAAKLASGRVRSERRAFNGAPPIIPHAADNTSDSACYSCHAQGVQFAGLRASVMSHQYLANCVQCHAPPPPAPFATLDWSVQTDFVGLPAPQAGERAFPGAPPTIPHSQWMRENCQACHGGPNGWAGMQTTHPWRTNCTQCHAPSAALDQAIPDHEVPMLPPLEIATK